MVNVTVIVALITALAAIVAPLITAQIQRKSNLEIKKLDTIYRDKSETYKAFSVSFGKLNENKYLDPHNEFLSLCYQVMLFANQACRDEILKLLEMINSGKEYKDPDLRDQFTRCMELLSKDLEISYADSK